MKKDNRGSFTVEAAFAVPFFIFAVTAFILLFKIMLLQLQLQCGLSEAAKEISQIAYIIENEKDTSLIGISSKFELQHEIEKYFSSHHEYKSVLRGPITYRSDNFRDNKLTNEQNIDLVANYTVGIPLPLLNLKSFHGIQRVRTRAFVGVNQLLSLNTTGLLEGSEKDSYVYVTETGTVYHLTLECSALRLNISQCRLNEVDNKRNVSGGKYKRCEKCCKGLKKMVWVYICEDGDRYHSSLGCSGLKRTIRKVPLSEIEGKMRGCFRCGGKS